LDNSLFGGIVIDRFNPRTDLFYYKIPPSLLEKAKIGSRVVVPFGDKNELKSGFIVSLTRNTPQFKTKEIIEILEEPLFDIKIYELLQFTSDNFMIPMHSLINNILRTISPTRFEKFIIPSDLDALQKIYNKSKGVKQELIKILLEKKFVSLSSLKRKYGEKVGKYITDLQKNNSIISRSVKTSTKIRVLQLNSCNHEYLLQEIDHTEKSSRKRVEKIIKRLLSSHNNILDETALINRVRDGKYLIDLLLSRKVISEQSSAITQAVPSYLLENKGGMSLEERSKQIINKIVEKLGEEERVLVIFPEIVLINRVKEIYEKAFGARLAVWEGKNKLKLLEQIKAGKRVILATAFSIFLNIPNLKMIAVESANSKYLKPGEFINFDVPIVALRRAWTEKLNIILSSAIPDENMFHLHQSNLIKKLEYPTKKTNIKIVDMRKEFRSKNINMLSGYMVKKMKEILTSDGNIALLINRKPFSTFIMCRECGYVLRCPRCKSPFYFNIDTKKLFCPVCGHEENLPQRCPRCKSINIHYFGGGIQKLQNEIKHMFNDANVFELISQTRIKQPVYSRNFKDTIFIGTEFLLSNLALENIDLFGFVSIDTFLQHFTFNSAVNTVSVFSEALTGMGSKEIIVQTYLPEHYAIKTLKNLDFENFFKQELYLRNELGYPPYKSLITLYIKGKGNFIKDLENTINKIENKFKGQVEILGPVQSSEQPDNVYNSYEFTIKTSLRPEELKESLLNSLESKNFEFKIRVFLSPDIAFK
jgi:primosomal protein N' (replication factor Y)